MSGGIRLPLAEAQALVERLWPQLGFAPVGPEYQQTAERILPAGSVRRQRPEVGDIELVAIPRLAVGSRQQAAGSKALFEDGGHGVPPHQERRNLLLEHLDWLLERGWIAQAIKRDGKTRWGNRYRAFTLNSERFPGAPPGLHVELFLAEPRNWGVVLAIRTGSAEFSQRMVSEILRRREYRVAGGFLRPTFHKRSEHPDGLTDAQIAALPVVDCPDEETFFAAAGLNAVPSPETREVST